jgi:hypothetical protein
MMLRSAYAFTLSVSSFVWLAWLPLGCSSEGTDPSSTESNATSEEGRPAQANEVRVIVQRNATSRKMCLMREPDGKLKASQCIVGGDMQGSTCALGGDGCFRVGRMDAWQALPVSDSTFLVDIVHLDGAFLSAHPPLEEGAKGTVSTAEKKDSSLGFTPRDQEVNAKQAPRLNGIISTPLSGTKTSPATEWCLTLEGSEGGDEVLGLALMSDRSDPSGCAIISLEPAKQVFGPLPTTPTPPR